MKTVTKKEIIKNYAHDYKGMKMSQEELENMLVMFVKDYGDTIDKKRQLNNLEKALKERPILPKEVSKEEYDKVINYLITIGFFKEIIVKDDMWDNADVQEIELFNMSKKDLIKIILDNQDKNS